MKRNTMTRNKVLVAVLVILLLTTGAKACKGDGPPPPKSDSKGAKKDTRPPGKVLNNGGSKAPIMVHYEDGGKPTEVGPGSDSNSMRNVTKVCTVKGSFIRDNNWWNYDVKFSGLKAGKCRGVERGDSIVVLTEWG